MPSSRRRFLAGVAALAGTAAGCNDRSSPSIEGTVTPVEVPRTDAEVLREAAAIEAPSIPSPVIVTEAHHEAAISHVEALRSSLADRLEEVDASDVDLDVSTRQAVERADDRLEAARTAGPSRNALETLRGTAGDLGRAEGVLRLATDDVAVEDVRAAVESERTAMDDLRGRVDYRIARPIVRYVPTVAAAERALDPQGDLRDAERRLEDVPENDPESASVRLASVFGRLERHRRLRDDAERFLETATADDVPSVRPAIDAEIDGIESELGAIADDHGERDREASESPSAVERLRLVRANVTGTVARFHADFSTYREDGRRLDGLLTGQERIIEYESIDAGVERTLPHLQSGEFPTERIVAEKRRAVEELERATNGTALQRRLVSRAPQLLRYSAQFDRQEEPDARQLAMAHLTVTGAAAWTERALSRGAAVSDSLQAQQS